MQRFPNSVGDIDGPEQILSMSGLDFVLALRDGRIAGPAIAATLNFRLDEVEEGRVTFRGAPELSAMNPMGGVHGGWYGTVLDSAMGCAVMTRVPKGRVYTTLEYKVNLPRAIPMGTDCVILGRVQHAGRTTAVAEGEIRGAADGRLFATGSTTCLIFAPQSR